MKKEERIGITLKQVASNGTVTVVFLPGDGYVLDDVLDYMVSFLRGCGYIIDSDKTLELVEQEK